VNTTFLGLLRSRVLGNAVLYTFGSVLQRGTALLILPVYTIYLTPADFGKWSLLITLFVLLVTLADLGMRSATVRLYYERHTQPEQLNAVLISGFLARLAAAGAVILLITVAGEPLWKPLVGGQVAFTPFAPLLAAAIATDLVLSYILAVLRAQGRAGRYVGLVLVQTLLQLGSSLFFIIVLRQGALGPLNGLLLATGTTALVASSLFLREHLKRQIRIDFPYLRECLAFGLPLVPHHLAGWARNSADRLILIQFVPLAGVGIYHLGYSAGMVMALLAQGIDMAYEPYYYRIRKAHGDAASIVRSVAGAVVAGLGGVCLVVVLFSDEIIRSLLAPDFHGAALVAPLILVSYLLHGVYTQVNKPLFYHRKTGLLPLLTGIPSLLTLAFALFLIPLWGIMAAAWLTFAGFLLTTVAVGWASSRIEPGGYPMGRIAACVSLVFCAAFWVTYQSAPWMPAANLTARLVMIIGYGLVAWHLLLRGQGVVLQRTFPDLAVRATT
jgi:O-antigen/teichoic acid export membrane protein